jgi:hypothetical protein
LQLSFYFNLHILEVMRNHPIKKGPENGRFQCSHGDRRYLLEGPIKKGPEGGLFQGPKSNPRYLLHGAKAKR